MAAMKRRPVGQPRNRMPEEQRRSVIEMLKRGETRVPVRKSWSRAAQMIAAGTAPRSSL